MKLTDYTCKGLPSVYVTDMERTFTYQEVFTLIDVEETNDFKRLLKMGLFEAIGNTIRTVAGHAQQAVAKANPLRRIDNAVHASVNNALDGIEGRITNAVQAGIQQALSNLPNAANQVTVSPDKNKSLKDVDLGLDKDTTIFIRPEETTSTRVDVAGESHQDQNLEDAVSKLKKKKSK